MQIHEPHPRLETLGAAALCSVVTSPPGSLMHAKGGEPLP